MAHSIYQDGGYLEHNPNWHAEDAPYKARWIHDLLSKTGIQPQTIAEVGCGSGEVLINVGNYYPDTTLAGFDISPQAFEICSKKATDRVGFYHEDLLKSKQGPFDLLMAIDVFEHVDDYMSFLRAIRGKATYKIFHIPLDLSVQTILRGSPIMRVRESVGHVHYFYKDSALATLRDTGYEILDWRYTHFSQELPDRPLPMRLLNLPRTLVRAVNEDFSVRLFGGSSLMVVTR